MLNNKLKGFISELEKLAIETDFTTVDDMARKWASKDTKDIGVSTLTGGAVGAALGTYLASAPGKSFLKSLMSKRSIFGASLGMTLAALSAGHHNKKVESARRWLTKGDTEKTRTNTFDKPFDLSFPIIPGHDIMFYQKGLL